MGMWEISTMGSGFASFSISPFILVMGNVGWGVCGFSKGVLLSLGFFWWYGLWMVGVGKGLALVVFILSTR